MTSRILLRRGTADQWSSVNPILSTGELGIETDTLKIKIGNGTSTWNQLTSYANVTPSQLTSEINNLINAAPATLDTLNELAAAINNDASFSTTVNNLLTGKVSKSGGDTITASSASTKGLIIRGAASQTANLTEWQDNTGIVKAYITSSGEVRTPFLGSTSTGKALLYTAASATGEFRIDTNVAANKGLVVRGAPSQTANLQEWQNSSGTADTSINSTGRLSVRTTLADAALNVGAPSAATVNAIIRGAASQTADLQQWQNSAGTVLANIASDGALRIDKIRASGGTGDRVDFTGGTDWAVTIPNNLLTTSVNLIIKAAPSQIANLQEWQDSSGTVLSYINASGALRVNSAFGGTQVAITAASAATIGAIIRGAASQTANLQEWQDSAGTVLASVIAGGSIRGFAGLYGANSANSSVNPLFVVNSVAANVVAVIKGAASQTANLQEWQDSTGAVLNRINSAGHLVASSRSVFGGATSIVSGMIVAAVSQEAAAVPILAKGSASQTADLQQFQNSAGSVLSRVQADGTFVWGSASSALQNSSGRLIINLGSAASVGITVKGAASQTANLQEWQDSIGGLLLRIDSAGGIRGQYIMSGNTGSGVLGQITSYSQSATTIGLVVRGAASQTANLQEWQNSAGTVLARISSGGNLLANDIGVGNSSAYGVGSFGSGSNSIQQLLVTNGAASRIGLIVKGAASQTADLQQWQNVGGTILSGVNAAGQLYFGSSSVVQSGAVGLASVTGDGTNATYTATSGYTIANPFIAGAKVTVSGYTGITGYNGTFTIASVGGTSGAYTFTVANTTTGTPGGTGASYQSADLSLTSENPWATPFIIKGTASQAGNLTEWQDSAGTIIARITNIGGLYVNSNISQNSSGRTFLGGTGDHNAFLNVSIPTASRQGIVVRANASQTANLQEWQDSSGSVMSRISSGGDIYAVSRSVLARFIQADNGAGAYIDLGFNNANSVSIVGRTSTTAPQLIVKGIASQTADLQQWQDSDGNIQARISKDGVIVSGTSSSPASGIQTGSASFAGVAWNGISNPAGTTTLPSLVVKGIASQTADLQQWQDSAGNSVTRVLSDGRVFATGQVSSTGDITSFYGMYAGGGVSGTYIGGALSAKPWSATVVGAIIRGYASQTADLQQWQDSAGTVLTRIDSSGQNIWTYSIRPQVTPSSGAFIQLDSNQVRVTQSTAGAVAFIVKGAASQTANLQEWQDSTGAVKMSVNQFGSIVASAGGTYISTFGDALFGARNATTIPLTVKGAASQTANLQEWQSSNGTVQSRMTDIGKLFSNYLQSSYGILTGNATYAGGYNFISNPSFATTDVSLIVKAVTSQTADLQQWQNSAGSIVSSIGPTGVASLSAGNYQYQYPTVTIGDAAYGFSAEGGYLRYYTAYSSGLGGHIWYGGPNNTYQRMVLRNNGSFVLKGVASQTANLQEWQDSAGSVLAKITASGSLELNGKDIELMNIMGAF